MSKKIKIVHYKRASFTDPTISLQSALSAALASASLADDRRQQFTDDEHIYRLINQHKKYSGMLFGQFITYEKGKKQPQVELGTGVSSYPVSTSDPGRNRAFADEIFYFGIRENDLICSQTRSMRTREFEAYLHWLLTENGIVASDVSLYLHDQPPTDVSDKLQQGSVKSLRVGTDITSTSTAGTEESKKTHEISGVGANWLRGVLGIDKFDKLNLSNDLDDANLKIYIEVKFLRKTDEQGQRAIDSIVSSMRHIDGTDYTLKLNNDVTIKGSELSISGTVSTPVLPSGLLDEAVLYKDMHDWLLKTLLENL